MSKKRRPVLWISRSLTFMAVPPCMALIFASIAIAASLVCREYVCVLPQIDGTRLLFSRPATENFFCRIMSRQARNTATRMSTGATEIEILDRRSIPCPSRDRTHEKHLIQRHFGVINVSFGQTEALFEVHGR